MLLWFIEKNCISLLIINHNNHYVLVVFLIFFYHMYIIVIINLLVLDLVVSLFDLSKTVLIK